MVTAVPGCTVHRAVVPHTSDVVVVAVGEVTLTAGLYLHWLYLDIHCCPLPPVVVAIYLSPFYDQAEER